MKKIIVIGLVFMFFTLITPNIVFSKQTIYNNYEWGYILKFGDVEQEVRRHYIGESNVPWADGLSGQQFNSQILTTQDGFYLPEEFFNHWQFALTQSLVNYWNFTIDSGFDFGWVYFHNSNYSKEDIFIGRQQEDHQF